MVRSYQLVFFLSALVNVELNLPFITCFYCSTNSASSSTSSSHQFGFLLSALVNVELNLPFITCFYCSTNSASSSTSSFHQFGFLLEYMVADYIIISRLYIGMSVYSCADRQ